MSDNLSPHQFGRLFHGSVSDLRGTHLVPGQYGGASAAQDEWKHHGQSKNDYVSATNDESKAWHFADLASAQRLGRTGRTRVYEVEPNEQTKIGIENLDHPVLQQAFREKWWKKPQPAGEHVAPSFRVIAQHDIKPGHQGTFPTINWNQFKAKGKVGDANHPPPEDHIAQAYSENTKRRIAERREQRENPTVSQKETLF